MTSSNTANERKVSIGKSYPACRDEAEFWEHHFEFLKAAEPAIRTLVEAKLAQLQQFDSAVVRAVALDANFMKSKLSLQSKVAREKYDMRQRSGAEALFGKDAFRLRVYLAKQGKDAKASEVIQLLQTLCGASSAGFELLRVKDKLTTQEWPLQFILNYWLTQFQIAVELQFMLCDPPDESYFD